jgi:hypothetical protein
MMWACIPTLTISDPRLFIKFRMAGNILSGIEIVVVSPGFNIHIFDDPLADGRAP